MPNEHTAGSLTRRPVLFSRLIGAYIASIVTGFSRFLPAGDGLLAFETMNDLLDRIARLNADYPKHARAARALAEEYFDSDTVLKQLLAKLNLA